MPGGLPDVYQRFADTQPHAAAVCDEVEQWSYLQLWEASGQLAGALVAAGVTPGVSERPVALCLPRDRCWYALVLAVWRLGRPVVALSLRELPGDGATERARASVVGEQLAPNVLIFASTEEAMGEEAATFTPAFPSECLKLTFDDLRQLTGEHTRPPPEVLIPKEHVLCYVYTGGTTKHSKCVPVTHAMALWEVQQYSTALRHLPHSGDRMLQFSPAYWGAAVFGQLDLALAFGACIVIVKSCGSEALAKAVERFQISVLGVVPSQLRGAWPGGPSTKPPSLRILVSWAERLPPQLAAQWKTEVQMFELLIASEYWLTFHSDLVLHRDRSEGVEKHVLHALPELDLKLIRSDGLEAQEGEEGEVLLAGDTVFPGYVTEHGIIDRSSECFQVIDGRRYYRTRDRMLRLQGGRLLYSGRVDSLTKRGGVWLDLEASESSILAIPGVTNAAVLDMDTDLHAFLSMDVSRFRESCSRTLDSVGRQLTGKSFKLHVWNELPVNAATGKVNKRLLREELHNVAARREDRAALLTSVQKRMLRGYLMWDLLLILAVFVLAGLRWEPIFVLPYAWGFVRYATERLPNGDRFFWNYKVGALEWTLLLSVAWGWLYRILSLLPLILHPSWRSHLWNYHDSSSSSSSNSVSSFSSSSSSSTSPSSSSASSYFTSFTFPLAASLAASPQPIRTAVCCAWRGDLAGALVLAGWTLYLRDGQRLTFVSLVMSALLLLLGGGGDEELFPAAVSTSTSASTSSSLDLAALLLALSSLLLCRERLRFLLSLPFCCILAFPKWCIEDYAWRSRSSLWRYRILRFMEQWHTPFDRSWSWDPNTASVDWGDDDFWSNITFWRNSGTAVVYTDLWLPAQLPPFLQSLDAATTAATTATMAASTSPSSTSTSASTMATSAGSSSPVAANSAGTPEDLGPLGPLLATIGCSPSSISALDSLQAIRLVELLRRDLRLAATVSQVLKCSSARELLEAVRKMPPLEEGEGFGSVAELQEGMPDEDGAYRMYVMAFPRSPVDWFVKFGGDGDALDLDALQRAANRLVARHESLQTVETPDEGMRQAMDAAGACWQLICSSCGCSDSRLWQFSRRLAAAALFGCWPRTVRRPVGAAQIPIRILQELYRPEGKENFTADRHAFWVHSPWRRQHRWPFDIFVVKVPEEAITSPSSDPATTAAAAATTTTTTTLEAPHLNGIKAGDRTTVAAPPAATAAASVSAAASPPVAVHWKSYIFMGITHAYSDGACGQALYGDLFRFYAEECRLGPRPLQQVDTSTCNSFKLLQRRLRKSLRGRLPGEAPDTNNDVYHEILCEDWGKRLGYQLNIEFMPRALSTLRIASQHVLACGNDVGWLTAILGALFRLFPQQRSIYLVLKCACRDGPGESEMVAFLSEQRTFAVDIMDPTRATLLDIAAKVDAARRSRSWWAPRPYEAGLCIYVNIVSSMLDRLPLGCRHVMQGASPPGLGLTTAYSHINFRLDQKTEEEWDFRIFHWDSAWGGVWGDYFSHAIGAVIQDMAENPTAALLPPPVHRLAKEPGPGPPGTSWPESSAVAATPAKAAPPPPSSDDDAAAAAAAMSLPPAAAAARRSAACLLELDDQAAPMVVDVGESPNTSSTSHKRKGEDLTGPLEVSCSKAPRGGIL